MIALFDSGVGGLTVLREIKKLLPTESTVYLADTAHFPFGQKSDADVCQFSLEAARILSTYSPDVLVVACNTASTAALPKVREQYKHIPVVGVVPALKPAAALSKSGTIGVLATQVTIKSQSYQELKKSVSPTNVVDQPCPECVSLVERGEVTGPAAEAEVKKHLDPLLSKGADVIVLGSTHFPFLRPVIEKLVGNTVAVVDSGQAVAEQVMKVLTEKRRTLDVHGTEKYLSTDAPGSFQKVARMLLERPVVVDQA